MGESLLEQEKYLEMVAWFQKRNHAYCYQRFIHIDEYEIMPMNGNQELPKWLEFNMVHGVIHLEGNPTIEDDGTVFDQVHQHQRTLRDGVYDWSLGQSFRWGRGCGEKG